MADLTETGDWLRDNERDDPRLVAIRAVLAEDGGTNWSSKVPRIRRILDSAYADAAEIAQVARVAAPIAAVGEEPLEPLVSTATTARKRSVRINHNDESGLPYYGT